jgi:hypothetical protein
VLSPLGDNVLQGNFFKHGFVRRSDTPCCHELTRVPPHEQNERARQGQLTNEAAVAKRLTCTSARRSSF